jgi:restriction endonuclease S subunit
MPVSIVSYDNIRDDMRLDAEFYHPDKLRAEKKLERFKSQISDNFEVIRQLRRAENDIIVKCIDLENISYFRIKDVKNEKGWKLNGSKKIIKKHDVIISRLRSYLKQIAINHNFDELYASTEFVILRQKQESEINPETLYIFLFSDEVQTILKWSQEGSNHPRFSSNLLSKIKIPIPTSDEQKDIENLIIKSNICFNLANQKYNEAISILNNEIKKISTLSKDEKCTDINRSDLIASQRMDAQFFSSKSLKAGHFGTISSKPLKIICNSINTGITPSKESYQKQGYPVLKMGALTNFEIDWLKIDFADDRYFKKSKRNLVEIEDIFLTSSAHAREHIGKKVDIIFEIPQLYNHTLTFVGELMRLRIKKDEINPYYLLAFLRSNTGYKLLQNCIRGQTAHIYPKDIQNIEIPIIDKEIQKQIENLLKESHSLIKKSSENIDYAKRKMESIIESDLR